MIIKKKSMVVAAISSSIICGVLVLTLVGYLFYLEIKNRASREAYRIQLEKIRSGSYERLP